MEFSLTELVAIVIKRFVFIITCTVAGLFSFFIVSKFIISPSFTASVQMYVYTNETATSANLNELNYAQKVVATYISFLQTNVFYKQVSEESNLKYTPDELKKMTSIGVVNNTEIFRISVTTNDPNDSFKIAETMQHVAPDLIRKIKSSAEISVVDPVVLPTNQSSPNVLLNTAVGGFLGLVFSIILSLLLEILDIKVKSQEELLKRYQLPILGAIPSFESNHKTTPKLKRFIYKITKRKNQVNIDKNEDDNKDDNIDDTNFALIEAYKSLRTNLRFTVRSDSCKKIIVSSPIPREGKSTTSTNLAIGIAQTGAKVLLMDCDLRKGRLHTFFSLKNTAGVSDTLSGMADVREIIRPTKYHNLHVITLGQFPPNPAELLGSIQMEELIKVLEKEYDYIIMDTPPVNIVSDSLSLVKLVDGVIIVVRENVTTHPNITNALSKFELVKANLLGFVINGVELNQGKSISHYYYYSNNNEND
jgi:polysaccharide biosynthesis transport protein